MAAQCTDAGPSVRAATALLAVAIALFVGGSPTATAQHLGTVTGTVTEAENGTALIGARMLLRTLGTAGLVQQTATDPDGTFHP